MSAHSDGDALPWDGWAPVAIVPTLELARPALALLEREHIAHTLCLEPDCEAAALELPAETVLLGVVLDMTTERGELRTFWEREFAGWVLLTDPGAEDMPEGEAALYLLPADSFERGPLEGSSAAQRTYRDWHARDAAHGGEIDDPAISPRAFYFCGEARTIGYRSDKWNAPGDAIDYEHDFAERRHVPPHVWADALELELATLIIVRGGTMRVTADGID